VLFLNVLLSRELAGVQFSQSLYKTRLLFFFTYIFNWSQSKAQLATAAENEEIFER